MRLVDLPLRPPAAPSHAHGSATVRAANRDVQRTVRRKTAQVDMTACACKERLMSLRGQIAELATAWDGLNARSRAQRWQSISDAVTSSLVQVYWTQANPASRCDCDMVVATLNELRTLLRVPQPGMHNALRARLDSMQTALGPDSAA